MIVTATLLALAGCGTQSLAAGPPPGTSSGPPPGSSSGPAATTRPSPSWHSSPVSRPTVTASPATSVDPLAGHAFVSTSVTRRGVSKALVDGLPIRIWFPPGGKLDAWDACTTITGTYRVEATSLRTGRLTTEHKNCSAAGVAQGNWLHGVLSSGPAWRVSGLTDHPGRIGGTLVLTWQNTVLRFTATALLQPITPLPPLYGTRWIVDTVYSGAIAANPPAGARATLTFTATGRVDGSAGCNALGGRAVVSGQTIAFSEIITTMMACGGGRDALERSVKAVLNADHVTYTLAGGHLTLRASTGPGLRLSPAS